MKKNYTINGQKIFNYYNKADAVEFANDWMTFFTTVRLGNQFNNWYEWCNEFADFALQYELFDNNPFNLVKATKKS
jgi:hypothetical protein